MKATATRVKRETIKPMATLKMSDFKTKIEGLFKEANPSATIAGWTKAPKWYTYPTGLRGVSGYFKAEAPGYRTKVMIAEYDDDFGYSIR